MRNTRKNITVWGNSVHKSDIYFPCHAKCLEHTCAKERNEGPGIDTAEILQNVWQLYLRAD